MRPEVEQLQNQVLGLMTELHDASVELGQAAKEWATTAHAYRQAKATAYLEAATSGEKKTVDHIKAIVDKRCDTQMLQARLAESRREAALQLVQSCRARLSAAQSLLKRETEEVAAIRYNQAVGA